MLKKYAIPLDKLFCLSDILLIILSYFLSLYLRVGALNFHYSVNKIEFQVFIVTFLVCWLILAKLFKLYFSKRSTPLIRELVNTIIIITSCLIISTFTSFFLRDMPLSRLYLLYFFSVLTIILVSYRIIIRKLLTYARAHGYNYRNVLFVGNNERTRKLINLINESPEFGYHILGFIDSDKTENKNNDSNGLKYLGNINNLEYIIKLMIIDEVIITLPIKSLYSEIANVINCCDDLGLNVKIATDLFSRKFSKSFVSLFGDHFFIEFYSSPLMDVQLIFKRFFDFTVSLIFIILLSPLFFILCILIKCTSKGPLLFKQTRVGYNGRFFKCLKFRSMVHNAEQMKKDLLRLNEVDGPVFKIKNDPRITPVGKFLRTYSLDELPQLFNVLKGDMSLVGPRPPTPDEVEKYKSHDRRRLSVRPGITCLWQVSGRNKLSFNEWMELDKEYIDNWNLLLDIKILFKTIPAVWRGTGV